ncbi:MAG: helix-turn-helix domain-containing protein [Rhodospirillales bacterium]|nr:helix-turn-helix domain-containing protein [Rhodospirillales bacterium]
MKRPLVISAESKRGAVGRLAAGESASAVAADLKVHRQRLYEWQDQVRQGGLEALRELTASRRPRPSIALTSSFRSSINDQPAVRRFAVSPEGCSPTRLSVGNAGNAGNLSHR